MALTRKLGSAIIAAALAGAALAQITGCAEEEVKSQQVAAPNPAALYCQKSGGGHLIQVRSDGSSPIIRGSRCVAPAPGISPTFTSG